MTPAFFYLLVAVGLISTELLIMQFSAFWFMFFGIGALVAALTGWLIPTLSFTAASAIFLGSSLLVAALLYPVLKKWQAQPAPIAGNDAIGQVAVVTEPISANKTGKVSWSGTDWPAQVGDADASYEVGAKVVIKKLEGIRLIVGEKHSEATS